MSDGRHDALIGTKATRISVAAERQLVCPAFPVTYPVVVNDDLIGEKSLQEMEVSWARGACAAKKVDIFRLRDIYVVDSLVFDSEFRLIENASVGVAALSVSNGLAAIRDAVQLEAIQHRDQLTVMVKRQGGQNYGHFLIDMLPLAVLGRTLFGHADPRYLVPYVQPAMQDVIFRSLRLAGIRPNRLIMQGGITPIHFKEVVVIVGLTEHGTYMSPFSVQAVTSLGLSLPPGPHRKLFVVRNEHAAGERPLVNQKELQTRLVARGFIAVDPGRSSFEEQVCLFQGADCVVGVLGAAMTNIVFCRSDTSVVSLVPADYPDTFFWFIANHRSLAFMEIRGDQQTYNGKNAWIKGFTIREQDIQFLENIAAGSVPAMIRAANAVTNVTLVHVDDEGDLRGVAGRWAGRRGSLHWIDGLSLDPPAGIPKEQLLYQVILHDGQESAWVQGKTFVGSRDQSQPLLGLRLLLRDEAALRYTCSYEAFFTDGSQSRLCGSGELCAAVDFAPMEALRVKISLREAAG